MSGPRDIAGLVASRICHDLISPIGALGNGMELIEAVGTDMSEELALVKDCSDAARHSLTYMRVAFGGAGPDDVIDPAELRAAAAPYLKARRLTVAWPDDGGGGSRLKAKARLLLLLAATDATPRGGEATTDDPEALVWRIEGKVIADDAVTGGIAAAGDDAQRTARNVHYAVLAETAAALGKAPYARRSGDVLEIGVA